MMPQMNLSLVLVSERFAWTGQGIIIQHLSVIAKAAHNVKLCAAVVEQALQLQLLSDYRVYLAGCAKFAIPFL